MEQRDVFDAKKAHLAAALIYWISVLPLLWIGWYNYPSADDFSMGLEVHQVYAATGSVLRALMEQVRMGYWYFRNWTGYYFADFFMAAPPNVYFERLYPVTTPVLIGGLTIGTLRFCRRFFSDLLGAGKDLAACIAYGILLITVHCMPEGSPRTEAFYWYSGAVNYTFLYGIGLLWLALLISLHLETDRKRRAVKLTAASVLGFFMGGANYMTALSLAIAGCLLMLLKWKETAIPVLLEIGGLIMACTVMGNINRVSDLGNENPVKAVLKSFYMLLSYPAKEWMGWHVIVPVLLLSPFLYLAAAQAKGTFRHPVIAVAGCYCLASANLTPPLYAMRNIGAGRMQAAAWEEFVLLLCLALFYCFGYLTHRAAGAQVLPRVPVNPRIWCAGLFFFVFGSGLSIMVNPHFYTGTSAVYDLGRGNAEKYLAECMEREAVLKDASISEAVLPDHAVKPPLLYFSDITTDPEDWINQAVATYYGKEKVVLTPQE